MTAPSRYLVIGADGLAVALGPNGEVCVELQGFEKEAGLTPGLGVMLALSPVEARAFVIALNNKIAEAEAKSPRH